MKEIWKKINNYNKYEISNFGNIREVKTKESVKTTVKQPCGYVYVTLGSKEYRVHKLVLIHFGGEPPKHNSVVGHKDNIKTNNVITNLYWTTTQENTIKAVEDGLITYYKGSENKYSNKVKVVNDKGDIVGVYGSIRECSRCIVNLTASYLSRVLKRNGAYKNISKNYKYMYCSEEEFLENKHLCGVRLEETVTDKRPTKFLVIYLDKNKVEVWDNQTTLGKKLNIPQSQISQYVRNESIVGNIQFKKIEKIDYVNSSGYNTMIDNKGGIRVRNIFTGDILEFKTIQLLKNYFGIRGHLTRNSRNLIFSEWEII